MTATLIQMTILITSGAVWRYMQPADMDAEQIRRVLTTVVYYLLLPAMVLQVLWQADIGEQSLQFTQMVLASILIGMIAIWCCAVLFRFDNSRTGAIILAVIPNVTFLGLPVLEQTFGVWARSVAIQIDLFATAPLVYTVGIMLARHYGDDNSSEKKSVLAFLNAPPFWAGAVAVICNLYQLPMPNWLDGVLQRFSDAVVPLMLFSLGLALNWHAVSLRNFPYVLPVIIIKMGLMPLFALWIVDFLGLAGEPKAAAVLEMAMPSMVIGIVFCDRYHLDSSLYAMAVTVTTILSLITLPFWYGVLH